MMVPCTWLEHTLLLQVLQLLPYSQWRRLTTDSKLPKQQVQLYTVVVSVQPVTWFSGVQSMLSMMQDASCVQ